MRVGLSGKCGSPNCERKNDGEQVDDSGEAHSGNSDRYAGECVCLQGTTIRFENEDEKGFLIRSGVMMNPEYEQVGRLL
jgi:hypothetical protein